MTETFIMSWQQTGHDFLRIVAAFVFALPIGLEREQEEHGIGIRTFPLVAMASCGFVLLGVTLDANDPAGPVGSLVTHLTDFGTIRRVGGSWHFWQMHFGSAAPLSVDTIYDT